VYSAELLSAQQAILAAPPPAAGPRGQPVVGAFGLDLGKRLELLGMARQDVEALRATGQIRYAQPVRAPIDGWVVRRGAYAGQYVQPGVELFQLVDLSTVWLLVDVYEDDLPRVRVGQRARLTVPARPGEAFTGRVDYLYPAVNPETRTLRARVVLRNEGLALRPGMIGDVVLEGTPVDGLVVPAEAVVDTGDRRYVFVARDGGRFEPRLVRTGLRAGDALQVLDGVADGERVVTTASFLVDSESRLRAAVDAFTSPPPDR
jgi:Cu(I)/Ag(I) efflux system membrane fusion protein